MVFILFFSSLRYRALSSFRMGQQAEALSSSAALQSQGFGASQLSKDMLNSECVGFSLYVFKASG